MLLADRGQQDEATARYREALRLQPDFADAWYNLGNVLRQQDRLDEALTCYDRFLQLQPDCADAHNNRGNVLLRLGQSDAALGCYEEALRLQPDLPEAHLNRALFWLLREDLERGWPEYEWRPGGMRRGPWPFAQPWWDGKTLEGRTILVHAEQGLGDTLQFVRYAPLVKQHGGTVLLLCPPALRALLTGFPGVDRLFVQGEPLPAFDVQAPLLSLPRLLGTTAASIPAAVPYLRADPHLVQRWRSELEPLTGCRVGIVWQGRPSHKGDRLRSAPLACFEPLARVPGVHLVSLQKGPGSEQARTAGFPVLDLSDRLDEQSGPFLDTAAVLANLDLLVGVDTAVVHLAGALGVPTWLALALAPDWRWQLGREDSPWYPSLRLFRQTRPGHWDDVFQRLAAALQQRVGAAAVTVPVSVGELLDKLTILEIKSERIRDAGKLGNVRRELAALVAVRDRVVPASPRLTQLAAELKEVNEILWQIEDDIRSCEARQDFGPRFVELARSVYQQNDRRAAVKRRINELLGSTLREEKEYAAY